MLADSGASHVLIRQIDDHVLNNREYTVDHDVPYATLKATSGHTLKAVGKGTLHESPIVLPAYIFKTCDLTSNLLGLAPFYDRDCTMTFTKTTVTIVHTPSNEVILAGHRPHNKGLWKVDLPPSNRDNDVTIPATPTYQVEPDGTHGTAHYMEQQDAASYVRFVHAAFGYPCPTTFMKAVGAGYITGPKQFPRLTTKIGSTTHAQCAGNGTRTPGQGPSRTTTRCIRSGERATTRPLFSGKTIGSTSPKCP